ncbi:MAG: hypothetical protein GY952_01050, partial [Rhodobacteraceae bacterium]|nr:hypothetical protein [Paracoccaceae bacterium]
FFELLIPQLVKYGHIEDGRNALEAVLEAAEIFVGQSKKESCESLIQQLRAISSGEEHSSGDPPLHTHRAFRQLLPRPEHFIGRENELADIMLTLQPGSVITLCGPGGIGKTALALETIWRLAEKNELLKRFLDGLIFYSFYGQPDVKLTFEHIVRSFDENASDTKKERVLRLLSRKTVLFVLDGAEEADNLQAVLDVRGNSGVIVTSRPKSDAPDERCDLPPLHAKEAEVLLCAWAGGCAAEDAAIQKICRRVGGLPLAVRLVGRYLNQTGETPAEYLEWLKKHPIEALSPSYAQHRDESVDILLRRSLEQVSPDARQALVIIGQLALAPFAIEPVTAAIDHSDRQIRNALGELVNYSLLERPDERYKVSHALIHNYAHKRVPVAGETVRRLAEYYIDFAKEHSQQDAEGYTRLDAERPHLLKVIENCRRQEEWQAVMSIVWAIGDLDGYLEQQGYWT